MVEGHIICKTCPNRGCHPALKPEELRFVGLGTRAVSLESDLRFHRSHLDCRHYTCNSDGAIARQQAERQLGKGNGKSYTVVGLNGRKYKVIGVEFYSGLKFTRGRYARITGDDGKVYSKQDGVFYPTGQ